MNAVIYARYSSDSQREESIDGQLRECSEYAQKNNIEIVGEYIDRAYSAKTDNRPEFQKMIKESYKKEFDAVLVWKLDRFARNRYDSARYKTILKKNGIQVVSATENISQAPDGIILEALLEGFAEYYSADLSEKVSRGMTENVLNGKSNGGNKTFGYNINAVTHKYEINEYQANVVKRVYEMYLSGISIENIIDYLKINDIKNSRGNYFNHETLKHMLQNRRYIGEYKFKDTINSNAIPPIISTELFLNVQKKILSVPKKKNNMQVLYKLSGLLECSNCSSQMVGECGTSKTGKIYYYYKCYQVKKHLGCDMKSPKKDIIENYVFEEIINMIKSHELKFSIIKNIEAISKKENDIVLALKRQYNVVSNKIDNLVETIANGLSSDSVILKLSQLENEKEELENKIEYETKILENAILTYEKIEYWFDNHLNEISDQTKTMLIHMFVEKIIY